MRKLLLAAVAALSLLCSCQQKSALAGSDAERYEGTYQQVGDLVTIAFDNTRSTLQLRQQGSSLFGRIGENTFSSTLTRVSK